MTTYKIVRYYAPDQKKEHHDVRGLSGLTLKEARAHCNKASSREEGKWFDGYTEE